MLGSRRGGALPDAGRQAGVGHAPPLPCLNSDNCSEAPRDGWYEGLGSHLGLDAFIRRFQIALTPYHRKAIFALRENLQAHIEDCSVDRVGFLTVSFKKKVFEFKVATKRFHSFVSSDAFSSLFGKWYRVAEQHKDGSWHFHMLVECFRDIRSGFDWDHWKAAKRSFKENKGISYAHLAKCCAMDHPIRIYWHGLVKLQERSSSVGRCQMEPLRSNSEGCGKYLSKYLDKGFQTNRINAELQKRKVERRRLVGKGGKANRAASSRFSWNSCGGMLWRARLAKIADHFGFEDLDRFAKRWGPRWAYKIKELITLLPVRDADGDLHMNVPVQLFEEFGERFGGLTPREVEEKIAQFVFNKLTQIP